MDTAAVKQQIKDLILDQDNKATLLLGLSKQGRERGIATITTSSLTPPDGYFYIAIAIPSSNEKSDPKAGVKTARHPIRMAEYSIEVIVADEALMSITEEEHYERMQTDFDNFVDRLIALIKDQTWIGTNPKLQLKRRPGDGDREIKKDEFSGTVLDTENNEWAGLYAILRFVLEGKCVS